MQVLAFYVPNNTTNTLTHSHGYELTHTHTETQGSSKAITNEKQTCGLTLMNARWDLCSVSVWVSVSVCVSVCFGPPLTLSQRLAHTVCLAEINVKYTHNKRRTRLLFLLCTFYSVIFFFAKVYVRRGVWGWQCVSHSFTHFKSLAQHVHLLMGVPV